MSIKQTLELMQRLLENAKTVNNETWMKFDLVMFDEEDKDDEKKSPYAIRGWIQIGNYWMFLYEDNSISLDYQPHDAIAESNVDFDRIVSFTMPPKPKNEEMP